MQNPLTTDFLVEKTTFSQDLGVILSTLEKIGKQEGFTRCLVSIFEDHKVIHGTIQSPSKDARPGEYSKKKAR